MINVLVTLICLISVKSFHDPAFFFTRIPLPLLFFSLLFSRSSSYVIKSLLMRKFYVLFIKGFTSTTIRQMMIDPKYHRWLKPSYKYIIIPVDLITAVPVRLPSIVFTGFREIKLTIWLIAQLNDVFVHIVWLSR